MFEEGNERVERGSTQSNRGFPSFALSEVRARGVRDSSRTLERLRSSRLGLATQFIVTSELESPPPCLVPKERPQPNPRIPSVLQERAGVPAGSTLSRATSSESFLLRTRRQSPRKRSNWGWFHHNLPGYHELPAAVSPFLRTSAVVRSSS